MPSIINRQRSAVSAMILPLVYAIPLIGMSAVLWWVGLNLPGTTGGPMTPALQNFVMSLGATGFSLGGLFLIIAFGKEHKKLLLWCVIAGILASFTLAGISFWILVQPLMP